jgi:hypothetical protein
MAFLRECNCGMEFSDGSRRAGVGNVEAVQALNSISTRSIRSLSSHEYSRTL